MKIISRIQAFRTFRRCGPFFVVQHLFRFIECVATDQFPCHFYLFIIFFLLNIIRLALAAWVWIEVEVWVNFKWCCVFCSVLFSWYFFSGTNIEMDSCKLRSSVDAYGMQYRWKWFSIFNGTKMTLYVVCCRLSTLNSIL